MKRVILLLSLSILPAIVLVACGPVVVVENKTTFPVRVLVRSGSESDVLSPSPGESSTAEVSEGPYKVVVMPDQEWIEYAKLTRKVLNEQLASADALSGQQLLEVIRRLKEIAERMAQYERAAASSAACLGTVASEGSGLVVVSTTADGKLAVSCK